MRTDLKLNYSQLEQVAERIGKYAETIRDMQDALDGMKSFLEEQESKSTDKLKDKLKDVKMDLQDKEDTLKELKDVMDSYISGMRRHVREVSGGQTRVDTLDISWNLGQIENAVGDLHSTVYGSVISGFYIGFGEEADEKKKKLERNYRKLDSFRTSSLIGLAKRLRDNVQNMKEIYKSQIKPYEKLDDSYRSQLNGIYDRCTSAKDKSKNFWDDFGKISDAFLENLVSAAAAAVVIGFAWAILPGVAIAGCVIAAGVGCAILASTPEEEVPSWLRGAKKTADGVRDKAVEVMKEGPIVLVEDIGQGFMDTVQTPEGIAAVTGMTVGSALGFKVGASVKGNVAPKKTSVEKGKGASGADDVVNVKLSKSKYPESTKHIEDAIKGGQPDTLTINRGGAKANRKASLKGIDKVPGADLDEYPPAMFDEGGKGASVRPINPSDNRGAGSTIGHQSREYPDGTKIKIELIE